MPADTAWLDQHVRIIEHYMEQTGGMAPPVRGGEVMPEQDAAARRSTAQLAGHHRTRASGTYLGAVLHRRQRDEPESPGEEAQRDAR